MVSGDAALAGRVSASTIPRISDFFWPAFSRRLFMMRVRLWRTGSPYRIRESSGFTLVVSQLVWTWSVGGKFNDYNANSNQLTIEWEQPMSDMREMK